jgi:hypothetical protein
MKPFASFLQYPSILGKREERHACCLHRTAQIEVLSLTANRRYTCRLKRPLYPFLF